jgi:exoribonuclease R
VVKVANRSRQTQRKVQDLSNEVVIDRLFAPELARPRAQRTVFRGTVMGLTQSKVHVRLDTPPIDLKLTLFDLGKALGGAWLEVADEGASMKKKGGQVPVFLLGQVIDLQLERRDEPNRRWIFAPV